MLALKRISFLYWRLDTYHFFIGTPLILSLSGCSTFEISDVSYTPWIVKYQTEEQYILPKRKRYDIEEDGLPAQIPPSMRIHSLPDDPSQPWSVNYGRKEIIDTTFRDEKQYKNNSQFSNNK